jgi:nucleotide-binding universal stress UspA family protein
VTTQQQVPVFRRILVAVDQTIASRWATHLTAQLAAESGARVALVHVLDISRGFSPEFGFVDETAVERLRPFGEELLDRAAAAVLKAGVAVDRIVHEGDPPQEIVAAADRWRADLIVVGTHGHGRLARLLLGSTAETVVRTAHCPVLTVGHEPTAAEASPEPVGAAVAAGEVASA